MVSRADLAIDEEEFHSSYRVFLNALETLSFSPEKQCEAMGNFNVAWELKDDVAAGKYLVGRGYLTPLQESWVNAVAGAVEAVPAQVLPAGAEPAANLEAMRHPYWVPLRIIAAHTLDALRPFSRENAQYLHIGRAGQ